MKLFYIYKSVILPRITFGAVAFWNRICPGISGNKTRITKLRTVQGSIISRITGAMKRSPLMPQIIMLGLLPLELEILKSALQCFCRLERTESWKFNNYAQGHGAIEKLMDGIHENRSSLEIKSHWRVSKKFVTSSTIRTRINNDNGLNIFVDASCDTSQSGLGMVINGDRPAGIRLKHFVSSNEAEKIALWWAVEEVTVAKCWTQEHSKISFWTDSLNLVRTLDKTIIENVNTLRCSDALSRLVEISGKVIEVLWIPKKARVEQMELVDKWAKESRYISKTLVNVECSGATETAIGKFLMQKAREAWTGMVINSCANARMLLNGPGDDRFNNVQMLGKAKLRMLTYIVTGKAPLGSLLVKMKKEGANETCRRCETGKENITHFLRHCTEQAIKFCRKETLRQEFPTPAHLKTCTIKELLTFAEKIGIAKMMEERRMCEEDEDSESHESDCHEDEGNVSSYKDDGNISSD